MVSHNSNQLTLRQLLDLQARLPKAIEFARARERAKVMRELATLAEKKGFTLPDLFGGHRSRRSLAPKYINPDDNSETWVGRGRRPKWLVTKIRKGAKLEHFTV